MGFPNDGSMESKMEYLKNNPQKAEVGFVGRVVSKLISKKYKVASHYELWLKHWLNYLDLSGKISVCEIGAGDGWAMSYKDDKIKKTIIDVDDFYKKRHEKNGIKFIQGALGSDGLKVKDKFDVVMANHVIEHIQNYQLAAKQLFDMTKKGGYVFIRVPDILKFGLTFWTCDFTHVKPYGVASLSRMMETVGFKTIEARNFSYSKFTVGYLFSSSIQKYMSKFGNEVLYIGRKE